MLCPRARANYVSSPGKVEIQVLTGKLTLGKINIKDANLITDNLSLSYKGSDVKIVSAQETGTGSVQLVLESMITVAEGETLIIA
ncbi:MAG: hypothetical protein HC896_01340 [Bacteroidales bacterium]|nr:hypothetical protein [Bacteroidales bacterium]